MAGWEIRPAIMAGPPLRRLISDAVCQANHLFVVVIRLREPPAGLNSCELDGPYVGYHRTAVAGTLYSSSYAAAAELHPRRS